MLTRFCRFVYVYGKVVIYQSVKLITSWSQLLRYVRVLPVWKFTFVLIVTHSWLKQGISILKAPSIVSVLLRGNRNLCLRHQHYQRQEDLHAVIPG
jgi:hypothetical protein